MSKLNEWVSVLRGVNIGLLESSDGVVFKNYLYK